jgi:hypothetical protein
MSTGISGRLVEADAGDEAILIGAELNSQLNRTVRSGIHHRRNCATGPDGDIRGAVCVQRKEGRQDNQGYQRQTYCRKFAK